MNFSYVISCVDLTAVVLLDGNLLCFITVLYSVFRFAISVRTMQLENADFFCKTEFLTRLNKKLPKCIRLRKKVKSSWTFKTDRFFYIFTTYYNVNPKNELVSSYVLYEIRGDNNGLFDCVIVSVKAKMSNIPQFQPVFCEDLLVYLVSITVN